MMTMSHDEVYAKVQDTLIDALGVDDDEVTEDARLMEDLGAESIDFLDIVFRLEKSFEIKIPREELFPGDDVFSNGEYVSDGQVTEAGLATLREQMAHVDLTEFEKNPDVNRIGDLFTVNSIVTYVETKIKGG
jgi:acyl carrier protein